MKTKMKSAAIATALAAMFATGSVAHAGVVVDLFTDPAAGQTVSTEITGATDFNQSGGPFASILGGYRDLSISKLTDLIGDVDQGGATLTAGFGALSLDNGSGITSRGVITWDGSNVAGAGGASVSPTGLGATGIDLTQGGANSFLARVLFSDLGFNYKIKVWDIDGSIATLSASAQIPVPITLGSDAYYAYDWFQLANGNYCDGVSAPPACANPATQLNFSILRGGNEGDIDFAHIGAFQFIFENDGEHLAADFALGKIQTVPEPGSMALLGLGLMCFGALRRRNQQA